MAHIPKPTTTIGPKELIDFPDLGLIKVPAKVDTGADSSAIWATMIHAAPAGLEFMLFGPGSRHFSGKPLTVSTFRTTLIKNSFGAIEPRYKVNLVVHIGGRRIRGWFTLSDRHSMAYPVLLGRRLLKNKFVVDVGKLGERSGPAGKNQVLLLATPADGLERFAAEVTAEMKSGAEIAVYQYDDLLFHVETGRSSVRLPDGTDVADFSLIYFKKHEMAYASAISVARYAAFQHVPFFDSELAACVSYDKLSEAMILATHGLPVAPGVCGERQRLRAEIDAAMSRWGLPLVCKEITGTRGHKNYLVRSKAEIESILAQADFNDRYLLQKYIENLGYIRLLVLGRSVAFGIQRTPVRHRDVQKMHLNNPANGLNVSFLDAEDIPPKAYELAIRSADVMGRQVAGVDIIQDIHTKEWYILEVNHAPQLATGAFPAEKRRALAKFIDAKLSR